MLSYHHVTYLPAGVLLKGKTGLLSLQDLGQCQGGSHGSNHNVSPRQPHRVPRREQGPVPSQKTTRTARRSTAGGPISAGRSPRPRRSHSRPSRSGRQIPHVWSRPGGQSPGLAGGPGDGAGDRNRDGPSPGVEGEPPSLEPTGPSLPSPPLLVTIEGMRMRF